MPSSLVLSSLDIRPAADCVAAAVPALASHAAVFAAVMPSSTALFACKCLAAVLALISASGTTGISLGAAGLYPSAPVMLSTVTVASLPFLPGTPGSPLSPFTPSLPGAPAGPCGPAGPVSPFAPGVPCGPVAPVSPLSPLRSATEIRLCHVRPPSVLYWI